MPTSFTTIVLADRGADALDRTLRAVRAQDRPAGAIAVAVPRGDAAMRELARIAAPDLIVAVDDGTRFGPAVAAAAEAVREHLWRGESPAERWLWFLRAGDEPDEDALRQLLATIEKNPSLEIAGPKLLDAEDPSRILEFGQTTTHAGETVHLHRGELDQGQFETLSDVLGVCARGMVVHATAWEALGGFDAGLPDADGGLELCMRARLADGRVVLAPAARVRVAADDLDEADYSAISRARLHRTLSASGPAEYLVGRALLVPAALLRSFWHLLRKQPSRILPDIAAAVQVALGRTGVAASRRRFAATRQHPYRILERLQLSRSEERHRRAVRREQMRAETQAERERYALAGAGGLWVLLAAAVVSVVLRAPLLGAPVLSGGGLLPLSGSLPELWGHIGYGVRDPGAGALGSADPFTLVLVLLGTLTFWQPSLSILVLWVLATPLAALGAWMLAARIALSPWLRAFAAFAWMLAAPLTGALADGRIAAVIAHIALPWLVLAGMRALRSWGGAAAAALLAALVLACSPSLLPALTAAWIALMLFGRRFRLRLLALPLPSAVLFAPLAVTQLNRGRPLGLLADPGVPFAVEPLRGPAVATGVPDTRLGGWSALLGGAVPEPAVLLACLAAPALLLAVLGLAGPGRRLAAVGLGLGLLGFATAVLAGGLALSTTGAASVPLSIAPGQSLMWLGVLLAAVAGVHGLGRGGAAAGLAALLGVGLLGAPAAGAQLLGVSAIGAGSGGALPAIVESQGRLDPRTGTLVITPMADGAMRVRLVRGTGETLDAQSTLRATAPALSATDERLASLATALATDPVYAPTSELHALGIAYILVEWPAPEAATMSARLVSAMDASGALQPAGRTEAGRLWQVANATSSPSDPSVSEPLGTGNADTLRGRGILLAQGVVLLAFVLLALPSAALDARTASQVAAPRPWTRLDRPEGQRRRPAVSIEQERLADADGDEAMSMTGLGGGDGDARTS